MMYFKDLSREKIIIKTALLGIFTNFILASIKIIIAFASNSVAIVSDAINNLGDAASAAITILGSKLAAKLPDEEHPYGYGRTEYIGGLIVSGFVLLLGFEFFTSSIKHIINPSPTTFSLPMLIILFIVIFVKFALAKLYRKNGTRTKSIALKAIGTEAVGDACISAIILFSAFLSYFFAINIDGYAGLIASVFIIFNGITLIKETFDKIIGQRVEKEVSDEIYAAVNECEIVLGSYDLILHNYGVERYVGSVNVEVDEHLATSEICARLNQLQIAIYKRYRVYLVFGIYAINLGQQSAKDCVINSLSEFKSIKSLHAFFINTAKKTVRFDIVVDFKEKNLKQLRSNITAKLSQIYPSYHIFIVIDREFV